jgi:uncharacterized membrane protein YfcA|tara:strand:- start:3035 stop:3751 length:717 start_codon:yes stop_codon:yes gene_type:complete
MSPLEILVVVVAVVAGSMVQATAGVGITLVAAPVLLAVDPAFVPLPLILGGAVVGIRNVTMEFAGFDARRWRRCLLGAPVGLVLGELALANLSERGLTAAIGLLVVISVGAMASGWQPRRRSWTSVLAGLLVAFSLRVAALPGPPYAILHHDDPPEVLRPNISALVLVLAGTISIRLLVGGEVTGADLGRVALVMGSALVGLLLAPPLRRWVDSGWFRPALLSVCGLGGLATALGAIL